MPRESLKGKKERGREIVRLLREHYPGARTSLDYKTPHQLLVATILSAQNTDKGVNAVTPGLFKKYRSIEAFAAADVSELARDLDKINFNNNKAKAIKQSSQQVLDLYGGEIPRTIDELTVLHGVGRKTASVVLGNVYGIAEGVVVDTHVIRVSGRLGLTSHKDPVKIERDLMVVLPQEDWIDWTHMVILHGRGICTARKPACGDCPLNEVCPSAFQFSHSKKR